MKKMFGLLLLCTSSMYSEENSSKQPTFAEPIHLLAPRNLAQRFAAKYSEIPAAVLAWLQTSNSYSQLESCIGRQLTQAGHDTKRSEIYSAAELQPSYIVLTASAQPTLEETIAALKNNGLAHHFIINTNGNIHPVTQEGETIEQALTHRLYALGISGRVIDGCREQRDMNSASISISIVGKHDQKITDEQTASLEALIKHLQTQYNIRADQVLDYGCVACFADGKYGRRTSHFNMPWKKLQEQGLATYPDQKIVNDTISNFKTEAERTIWISQALRKIGYICPNTNNSENEHFKAALLAFTVHASNNFYDDKSIIGLLNSMIIQHEKHNPKLKEIQPPALPLRAEQVSIIQRLKNIF